MKKHNSRRRKGAVEMSMQTIIVVVIGVTLLTLGLKFTYDAFKGISEKQDKIQDLTEGELAKLFGESEETLSISPSTTSIKLGKTGEVVLRIRNNENTEITGAKIGISVIGTEDAEKAKDWFLYDTDSFDLKSGAGVKNTIVITPKGVSLGTYLAKFKLDCSGESPCGDNIQLTIKVI